MRGLRENIKHKIQTILLFPRFHHYPRIQLPDQTVFLQKGYAFVRASGQSEKRILNFQLFENKQTSYGKIKQK